jgi:hypothetical protein
VAMVSKLRAVGVDEIACLIDFGLDHESVLGGLQVLNELRARCEAARTARRSSLASQLRKYEVTHLQCTPSLAEMMVQDRATFEAMSSLKLLLVGGEPLPALLARRLSEALPATVLNMYGPTETTIWSTTHALDAKEASVSIGRPIANTQTYILDPQMMPVPIGVPGRLFIGGEGVTRGYLHRPELTAERFVPDPFSGSPGGRLYDTGDVACYTARGDLTFLGRRDRQVKIRGHRIELGEVEAVLLASPLVSSAYVKTCTVGQQTHLVAYVVASGSSAPPVEELRRHAAAKLPEAMIPGHFVFLPSLPRTHNQKIDPAALPAFDPEQGRASRLPSPPRTPLEADLARLWAGLLQVTEVGLHTHFFEAGGHSLLATQMVLAVRDRWGVNLPVTSAFDHPTLAGFAESILRCQSAQADEAVLSELLDELEHMNDEAVARALTLTLEENRP